MSNILGKIKLIIITTLIFGCSERHPKESIHEVFKKIEDDSLVLFTNIQIKRVDRGLDHIVLILPDSSIIYIRSFFWYIVMAIWILTAPALSTVKVEIPSKSKLLFSSAVNLFNSLGARTPVN